MSSIRSSRFFKIAEKTQNNIQVKIVMVNGGTVGLAMGIIDDTCLVFSRSVLDGALQGDFFKSVGLDGMMITTVNAGMTSSTLGQLMFQVSFTGLFRLIAWCYRKYFDHLVSKCKKQRESEKRIS